jgi:hypothetical protein
LVYNGDIGYIEDVEPGTGELGRTRPGEARPGCATRFADAPNKLAVDIDGGLALKGRNKAIVSWAFYFLYFISTTRKRAVISPTFVTSCHRTGGLNTIHVRFQAMLQYDREPALVLMRFAAVNSRYPQE